MATFQEIRRRVTLGTVLSLDRFAEEATYFPGNGPSRTVRVVVQPVAGQLVDRDHERVTEEQIDVLVSREASVELDGETIGGIDTPRQADRLVRATDERPYFFETVQKETAYDWILRFSRQRIHQTGTAQAGKL